MIHPSIHTLAILLLELSFWYPAFGTVMTYWMEYVRWLLALPEAGYDTTGKCEALLQWEHTLRKRRSPLWRPVYWFHDLKMRVFVYFLRLRNFLWAGTISL